MSVGVAPPKVMVYVMVVVFGFTIKVVPGSPGLSVEQLVAGSRGSELIVGRVKLSMVSVGFESESQPCSPRLHMISVLAVFVLESQPF